jgi:hypothetical protein
MAENKEILNQTPESVKETEGLEDVQSRGKTEKVPEGIKNWLERVEEDPVKMKTVNDINGQPVLQPATSQKPVIILPVSRAKFIAGFKKTIDDAGRWLSTFILRFIKKKDGKVKFKDK